jgi:hypothetical protein
MKVMSMNEFEITCINKPNRMSPHEHIQYIGNQGGHWKLTLTSAIARINGKTEAFYTVDRATGRKVHIAVVIGDGGKAPYLRTHADGKWNDNLLALPECGADCKVIN